MKRVPAPVLWVVGSLLILLVWSLAVIVFAEAGIPPPTSSLANIARNMNQYVDLARVTVTEAFAGLLLASACAATLFVAMGIFPPFKDIAYPFIIFVKATPVIAVAPLIVFLVGSGLLARILVSMIISFFPIVISSIDGMNQTPGRLRLTAAVYGADTMREFFQIRVYYGLIGFLTGLKTAAPLSVVGAMVGEWVAGGSPPGLGTFLASNAANVVAKESVFAATLLSACLGLIFFGASHAIYATVHEKLRTTK